MLYLSHLMPDDDTAALLKEHGLGLETIEFSIGYCLDDWQAKAAAYKERLKAMEWEGPLTVHGPFLDLRPGNGLRRRTRRPGNWGPGRSFFTPVSCP